MDAKGAGNNADAIKNSHQVLVKYAYQVLTPLDPLKQIVRLPNFHQGKDRGDLRVFEFRQHMSQSVPSYQRIGVHGRKELAFGILKRRVQSRPLASIRLRYKPQLAARILAHDSLSHRLRL